ncbi:MAG TPA: hypothetical protein VIU40_07250 [Geobacteraceae bacterium]
MPVPPETGQSQHCATRLDTLRLWRCLVHKSPHCPYRIVYWSRRYCVHQDSRTFVRNSGRDRSE